MKKLMIITCALLGTYLTAWSQVHFDVKFGASPGTKPVSAGLIVNRDNPHEEFVFNMVQVKPQFYGGIRANVQLASPFFLESGISYTRKTSRYQLNYTMHSKEHPEEMYMNESEDMFLLPVDIGVSIGDIDVTSGLTAMKTISSIKELSHLKGFQTDGNSIKLGWQMGVRYGFKRTLVGVEYQGSLNRVGHGMYVNGKPLEIMNVPGKMVFTMQYRF